MAEHHKKNPTHGQKVTLGENAPSWQESTGNVPKDSLAADSVEHGGEFSINRGVEAPSKPEKNASSKSEKPTSKPEKVSSKPEKSTSKSENAPAKSEHFTRSKAENTKPKTTGTSRTENAPSAGSETYAEAVKAPAEYHGESGGANPAKHAGHRNRRDSWPHGKNLHEGIDYKGTEDGMAKAMKAELGSDDDPSRLAELRFQKQNELRAAGDTGPRQYETAGKASYENLEEQQA